MYHYVVLEFGQNHPTPVTVKTLLLFFRY